MQSYGLGAGVSHMNRGDKRQCSRNVTGLGKTHQAANNQKLVICLTVARSPSRQRPDEQ